MKNRNIMFTAEGVQMYHLADTQYSIPTTKYCLTMATSTATVTAKVTTLTASTATCTEYTRSSEYLRAYPDVLLVSIQVREFALRLPTRSITVITKPLDKKLQGTISLLSVAKDILYEEFTFCQLMLEDFRERNTRAIEGAHTHHMHCLLGTQHWFTTSLALDKGYLVVVVTICS